MVSPPDPDSLSQASSLGSSGVEEEEEEENPGLMKTHFDTLTTTVASTGLSFFP